MASLLFSCTHTGLIDHPWWVVDLGERVLVKEVHVTNRGDCCGKYHGRFVIW